MNTMSNSGGYLGAGRGGHPPYGVNRPKMETTLHITWIEAIGSYLLMKGHYDVRNISRIPNHLMKMLDDCFIIDPSWSTECKINLLLPSTICIYKGDRIALNKDIKCARARILNVTESMTRKQQQSSSSSPSPPRSSSSSSSSRTTTTTTSSSRQHDVEVEIELVDYGNHIKVGCEQLFFPKDPEQLQNIPYTLTDNVLLGVCEEWQKDQLIYMRDMFTNSNVPTCIIEEYFQYKFVTMQWNHFDFTEYLIMQEKLGFHISNEVMLADFKSKIPKSISSTNKMLLKDKEEEEEEKGAGAIAATSEFRIRNLNGTADKYKSNNTNNNTKNSPPPSSSSSSIGDGIYTKSFNKIIGNATNYNNFENNNKEMTTTTTMMMVGGGGGGGQSSLFPHLPPRSDPKYLSKRLQCLQIGGGSGGQYHSQIPSNPILSNPMTSFNPFVENPTTTTTKTNPFEQKSNNETMMTMMMPRIPNSSSRSSSTLLSNINPFNVQSRLTKYSAAATAVNANNNTNNNNNALKPIIPQTVGNIRSILKSVPYQQQNAGINNINNNNIPSMMKKATTNIGNDQFHVIQEEKRQSNNHNNHNNNNNNNGNGNSGNNIPMKSIKIDNNDDASLNIDGVHKNNKKSSIVKNSTLLERRLAAAINNNNDNRLLQQQQQQSTTIATTTTTRRTTYELSTLTIGQIYDFHICFVENGPYLFCGQLVSRLDELSEMMKRIEEYQKLERLKLKQITIGIPCIAKYPLDSNLYRALIVNVNENHCKVLYIDYGNADIVQYHDLYEIPMEFLNYKTFAIRFKLSDLKQLATTIDKSLMKIFSDLIIYRQCKLRIMPSEDGGSALSSSTNHIQYCQLFINEKNILELVKEIQMTRLVYIKAEPLQNDDQIEIRYIHTPQKFFVQKVSNIQVFHNLMDDMYEYYTRHQNIPKNLPTIGTPCVVETDREWYRAIVKDIIDKDTGKILVHHIDFGYEETVTKDRMSTIAVQHLKLPQQAVECCLKGYEGRKEISDNCTTRLEMMAQDAEKETRRIFTVKVFRIQPDGVNLVNLFTNKLDVMKRLQMLSVSYNQYLQMEKNNFNMEKNNFNTEKNASWVMKVEEEDRNRQQQQRKTTTPTTTTTTTNENGSSSASSSSSSSISPNGKKYRNNIEQRLKSPTTSKLMKDNRASNTNIDKYKENSMNLELQEQQQQQQYTLPKFQQERINHHHHHHHQLTNENGNKSDESESMTSKRLHPEQKQKKHQQQPSMMMTTKSMQQNLKRTKLNATAGAAAAATTTSTTTATTNVMELKKPISIEVEKNDATKLEPKIQNNSNNSRKTKSSELNASSSSSSSSSSITAATTTTTTTSRTTSRASSVASMTSSMSPTQSIEKQQQKMKNSPNQLLETSNKNKNKNSIEKDNKSCSSSAESVKDDKDEDHEQEIDKNQSNDEEKMRINSRIEEMKITNEENKKEEEENNAGKRTTSEEKGGVAATGSGGGETNKRRLKGYLAHCHNPAQFYIHPIERIRELKKLQENLQIVATSLPPLMRVSKGSQCISMYSVDKQWYRSKILDDELMVLQFIDYGNTDCVNDCAGLKEMIVFPDLAPFCIPCSLPIAPSIGREWVDAANTIFNQSFHKVLEYEYITTNVKHDDEHSNPKKCNYINLYIDNTNITDCLIRDGYAKPLQLIETGTRAFISHINSIGDFYMQCESRVKCLEMIEMHLNDGYWNDSSDDSSVHLLTERNAIHGKIVAALYSEDSTWYRAKILRKIQSSSSSESEDSLLTASLYSSCNFEVQFIDYGNISITTECREISEELANIPPLAQRCAIELPDIYEDWSEEAENRFLEMGANGQTIFTVVLCEPAIDRVYINLLENNYNITDELLRLCRRTISNDENDREEMDRRGGGAGGGGGGGDGNDGDDDDDSEDNSSSPHLNWGRVHDGSTLSFSTMGGRSSSIVSDFDSDLTREELANSNSTVTFMSSLNDIYLQTHEDRLKYDEIRVILKLIAKGIGVRKITNPELQEIYGYCDLRQNIFIRVRILDKCCDQIPGQIYLIHCIDFGHDIYNRPEGFFFNINDDKILDQKPLAKRYKLFGGDDLIKIYGRVICNFYMMSILEKYRNVVTISGVEKDRLPPSSSLNETSTTTSTTTSPKIIDMFCDNGKVNVLELLEKRLNDAANNDTESDGTRPPTTTTTTTTNSATISSPELGMVNTSVTSSNSTTDDHHHHSKIMDTASSYTSSASSSSCIISYANTPEDFYLQMQNDDDRQQLDLIKSTLQDNQFTETLKTLKTLKVGELCCVYSEKDDCYHRGRCISEKRTRKENNTDCSSDNELYYKIFLIDYGHQLTVKLSDNLLKEYPDVLKDIPGLAKRCRLKSLSEKIKSNVNTKHLKEVFLAVIESHFGEIFEILEEDIIETADNDSEDNNDDNDAIDDNKISSVKLRIGYKDLLQELLDKLQIYNNDSPEKAFSPLPIVHNCTVIHVNSSQSFYVQFHNDISNLERITTTLQQLYEGDELKEFSAENPATIGCKCVALFPDDGAFYRAQILKIHDDDDDNEHQEEKYEVIYIDFGNTSHTHKIYQMPTELLEEEAYSHHCSLGDDSMAISISNRFMEYIDEHFTETFKLEMLVSTSAFSVTEVNVVRLFHREKDLLNTLNSGGGCGGGGGGGKMLGGG